MCGLAGILLYPQERSAAAWQRLRDLFTQMLVFNEERGRDASGVALIHVDGTYRLYKQPLPATELVRTPTYHAMLSELGATTTCVLGHTRLPTKGSRWNNLNNHPVKAGHLLGIHNGFITNDDELFATLGLSRLGEVDSEIIFRLLESVSPIACNGLLARAVSGRAGLLAGTFATLSVDLRRPGRLLALKHLCPLCVHYEPSLQALFLASRYVFLRRAFGQSVITEALRPDHGFVFDAERLASTGRPTEEFPLELWGGQAP